MKNFVVEPNVVNKVSNVSVSVENEMPDDVLNCSFLQEEEQTDKNKQMLNSI